jgi:hypothetical protein
VGAWRRSPLISSNRCHAPTNVPVSAVTPRGLAAGSTGRTAPPPKADLTASTSRRGRRRLPRPNAMPQCSAASGGARGDAVPRAPSRSLAWLRSSDPPTGVGVHRSIRRPPNRRLAGLRRARVDLLQGTVRLLRSTLGCPRRARVAGRSACPASSCGKSCGNSRRSYLRECSPDRWTLLTRIPSTIGRGSMQKSCSQRVLWAREAPPSSSVSDPTSLYRPVRRMVKDREAS